MSETTSLSNLPDQGNETASEGAPTEDEDTELTGFSGRKREIGQKLANAGVWPRRIPELLRRFAADRIEANFELFRRRAQSKAIERPGAWLATAIEEGYAGYTAATEAEPASGSRGGQASPEEPTGEPPAPSLPEPGTKVSEARKRSLIAEGLAEGADFEKFADYDDPSLKQHFFRLEKTPSPARG